MIPEKSSGSCRGWREEEEREREEKEKELLQLLVVFGEDDLKINHSRPSIPSSV